MKLAIKCGFASVEDENFSQRMAVLYHTSLSLCPEAALVTSDASDDAGWSLVVPDGFDQLPELARRAKLIGFTVSP
jgi:hypothetical protein